MFTAEQHIEQAQRAIETLQPELAIKLFERAYSIEPSASTASAIASLFALSDQTLARHWFSVAVQTDSSLWIAHLQLAQLAVSEEALHHYSEALRILEPLNSIAVVNHEYCSCLCALTELYLTDLCFAGDAEAKCEQYMAMVSSSFNLGPLCYLQ